jgi:type I restriction enzyme, S subunit
MSEVILEQESKLPSGWSLTSLENISLILRAGGTPSTKNSNYYENGIIPFVKIDDISKSGKYLDSTKIKITEEGIRNSSAWKIPKNSILYSMYASYGIPIINRLIVSTSQAIIAYVPPSSNFISIDYVFHFLQFITPTLIPKGTTQKNLNANLIRNMIIKLPPINEQKRIVETIGELLFLTSSIRKKLNLSYDQLSNFHSSYLNSLFSGNLTKIWRSEFSSKLNSTKELLDIIFEKSNYSKASRSDFSNDFNLPDTWVLCPLNYISKKIVDGTHKTPKYQEKGILFLSAKNIFEQIIHLEKIRHISKTEHAELIKRCHPEFGDVMLTKSGTIGRTAVVPKNSIFSLFESVSLIKCNGELIDSEFLSYFLEFHVSKQSIMQTMKGVAVKHFHLEDIRKTMIPVPNLIEQQKIVEIMKKTHSQILFHKKSIKTLLDILNKLESTILKKAFEGKLVPQDPNDEPAETLLQKIKVEKQQLIQKQKASRRSKNV